MSQKGGEAYLALAIEGPPNIDSCRPLCAGFPPFRGDHRNRRESAPKAVISVHVE
jgi:hypothetical protein